MKKLLTISMAAALALGASAATRQQMSTSTLELSNQNFRSEVTMSSKKQLASPARVRALQNYEGTYEWNHYDCYDYNKWMTNELEMTLVDASTGEFSMSGFPGGLSVHCFIDPIANTMKIYQPQNLGNDFLGDNNSFYLKETTWQNGCMDVEYALGRINGATITFPSDEIWVIGNYPDDWMYWKMASDNSLTFLGEIVDGGDPEEPLEGVDRIAGDYVLTYTPLLTNDAGTPKDVTITVTNPATGEVAINGIISASIVSIPIKGFFSPSENTLTIPNDQYLGKDKGGDETYFYLRPVSGSSIQPGISSAAASVGTLSADNVITFPGLDVWAIGDYNNESLGFWFMSYNNVLTGESDPVDPNEGWEDYADATFEDGWILPAYNNGGVPILPSEYPWEIKVQRNIENPNLLRLDNPYMAEGNPMPASEFSNGGYIEINIEKPDFVTVTPGIFMGALNGNTKLMALNHAGFYAAQGFTQEEIEAGLEGYIPSTYDAATGVISLPQVGFNFASAADKYYTWQNESGESLAGNMNTKITMHNFVTGVDAVASEKAPVVYYNLQGQRVANPSNGVFIRVEGGKSTKVIK